MPIEITCPDCQARLLVPDEAAGEQAKCPHCERVFDVSVTIQPDASGRPSWDPDSARVPDEPTSDPFAETAASPAYAERSSPERSKNPYASPLAESSMEGPGTVEMELGQLDAGTAVRLSWELLKANMPTLMLANGVVILASLILGALGSGVEEINNAGVTLLFNLISYCAQWFLSIGITIVNLNVARGRPADVAMVFSGAPWFVRVAIATLLFSLMVMLGMVLFIVPGIYLASRFWAYQCFIVDRDCGVLESFNLSAKYMEGNKMQAFVMLFMTVAIALVGLIAFCVGLVFAIPVITMTWVVAYLMVTRQVIQRPVSH